MIPVPPILVGTRRIGGDAAAEAARLEALAADLRRLAGGGPTAAELDGAPLLDGWSLAPRHSPCLVGLCADHPSLHGPWIVTSDVWALAPELGWARTLSRWYRLGRRGCCAAAP